MTTKIYTSLNKPNYLPEVSQLIFAEWKPQLKKEKIYTLQQCLQYLINEFQQKKDSAMFLAIRNNILQGFVFLEEEDMIDRKQYSPWLSSLYVKEEYRHRGIASKLVKNIIKCCKKSSADTNIQSLYLWCYPKYCYFYNNKGFSLLEEKKYCGEDIIIMIYNLSNK
jgi:GNAT superfamily N-acetyltransferase